MDGMIPAAPAIKRFWLWRDGDSLLAYSNRFPTVDGGDPAVLGDPAFSVYLGESVKDGVRLSYTEAFSYVPPPCDVEPSE